jgi:hypothetical protein
MDLKGFVFESGLDFNNYEISNTSKCSKNDTGNPVYVERNTIINKYKEIVLTLTNKDNSKIVVQLVCRFFGWGARKID